MATFFLITIYIAFISLGLPDTLMGSAWTVMQSDLGVPLSAQGLVTLTVCLATIVSCLASGFLVRKLGTGKIVFLSCLITSLSIIGYSQVPSFPFLILLAIPLGLGAGSVDTSLNNYCALHLTARQMNWQHCCYGLGAMLGPLILSVILGADGGWRSGYLTIGIIQLFIAVVLFLSLPLWKGRDYKGSEPDPAAAAPTGPKIPLFRVPGVAPALISYALAFGIEIGAALWAPSYMVGGRGLEPETAARVISVYYLCLMVGRFVSGILAAKLTSQTLIRIGIVICIVGFVLLGLDLPTPMYFVAMALTGFGVSPVFPCMLHLTPTRFGRENSQRVMGVQMAAAYAGSAIFAPILGLLAQHISLYVVPWFVLILCVVIVCLSETTDRICARAKK